MAGVELKNIKKSYDGKHNVINGIDAVIKDKEFIVIVGSSGCGKSTILRMIAGLEDINGGEILIDDKVVNNLHPKDRDIAFVFQNYALYPHMSVYDNMAFGLKMRKYKKSEIKQKVDEAAEILGLKSYLNRKPKQLSGGQRQRVALGRAIVRNPKVFLMDEPLSNLDANLRVKMRSEIKKLHKKLETTFIYVTHDQTEALTMGDRIMVLDKGTIQQFDTPENIYNHPKNKFVAGFLGQMNFINSAVSDDGIEINGCKITLKEDVLKKLDGMPEVIVGIRPEAMNGDNYKINIKPEIAELTGCYKNVYFKLNGIDCQTVVPAETNIDDDFCIGIDADDLYFFDSFSGDAIYGDSGFENLSGV